MEGLPWSPPARLDAPQDCWLGPARDGAGQGVFTRGVAVAVCLSPPRPAAGQLKSYCTGTEGRRDLRAEVSPTWAVEGHVCDMCGGCA